MLTGKQTNVGRWLTGKSVFPVWPHRHWRCHYQFAYTNCQKPLCCFFRCAFWCNFRIHTSCKQCKGGYGSDGKCHLSVTTSIIMQFIQFTGVRNRKTKRIKGCSRKKMSKTIYQIKEMTRDTDTHFKSCNFAITITEHWRKQQPISGSIIDERGGEEGKIQLFHHHFMFSLFFFFFLLQLYQLCP